MNDKLHELLYLASWLYNIGKFRERAGIHLNADSLEYLGTGKMSSEMARFLHTREFILGYESLFANAYLDITELTGGKDSFTGLASTCAEGSDHSDLQKIILQAELLAIGKKSRDAPIAHVGEESKLAMTSVFEGLFGRQQRHTLPLAAQEKDSIPFLDQGLEATEEDYKTLWGQFIGQFDTLLKKPGPKALLLTIPFLLEKYTGSIPLSSSQQDVSLYDHSKMMAAFASCLYQWSESEKPEKEFLLVGGDLSGIQKFLYDISGKNAAKNLKGRSFYLQMLVDSTLRKLMEDTGIHNANIVYSSGGGFYLLAPNLPHVKESIRTTGQDINGFLFDSFGTRLFMAMDYAEFSTDTVLEEGISGLWKQAAENMGSQKMKKFDKLVYEHYGKFFEPEPVNAKQLRDAITGEEIEKGMKNLTYEKGKIREVTWEQIELGRSLKGAYCVLVSSRPLQDSGHGFSVGDLRYRYYFLKGDTQIRSIMAGNSDAIMEAQIMDLNAPLESFTDIPLSYHLSGGHDYPVYTSAIKNEKGETVHYPGEPVSYDVFTGEGSFKRLGYLRMDVDHLGMVFKKGLQTLGATFPRYSTLSRQMDLFFKGHLDTIIARDEYRDHTMIIYAGGDDLFLVSRWDSAIRIAQEIRETFGKYTCNSLSISGGLAITGGKYPILRAAQDSGQAEDSAKHHEIPVDSKSGTGSEINDRNSFSFLGYPLNWETEFPLVMEIREKLFSLIENETGDKFPSSLFGRIHKYHDLSGVKTNHKITNLKTGWMMAYDFKRLRDQYKHNPGLCRFIENLQHDVSTNTINGIRPGTKYHSLELYMIASRWSELLKRTNDKF